MWSLFLFYVFLSTAVATNLSFNATDSENRTFHCKIQNQVNFTNLLNNINSSSTRNWIQDVKTPQNTSCTGICLSHVACYVANKSYNNALTQNWDKLNNLVFVKTCSNTTSLRAIYVNNCSRIGSGNGNGNGNGWIGEKSFRDSLAWTGEGPKKIELINQAIESSGKDLLKISSEILVQLPIILYNESLFRTEVFEVDFKNFYGQASTVPTNKNFEWARNNTSVSIPSSMLHLVDKNSNSENGVKGQIEVVIVQYHTLALFSPSGNNTSTDNISTVLSVDIGNSSVTDSPEPIRLEFKNALEKAGVAQQAGLSLAELMFQENLEMKCVYWNFTDPDNTRWERKGCSLRNQFPPTCECSHTTSFALIVNQKNDIVSDILSRIGFALSIAGLSLTLIVQGLYRDLRKTRGSKIIINVCLNLLLGYLIFVIGIEATSLYGLCYTICFLLHFFFLSAWGWMTLYSYDMYSSVVKVFGKHQSMFLRKFGSGIYALALLVCAATLGITKLLQYINSDHVDNFSTYAYHKRAQCWLSVTPLMISFILPIGIMLVFNFVVFGLVFKEILGKSGIECSAGQRTTKQQLSVAVTMILFTGLAWVFGFLLLLGNLFNNETYTSVFNVLFVVFNTTQGFGIFLLVTARKEARKVWWDPIHTKMSDAIASIATKSSIDAEIDMKGLTNSSSVVGDSSVYDYYANGRYTPKEIVTDSKIDAL